MVAVETKKLLSVCSWESTNINGKRLACLRSTMAAVKSQQARGNRKTMGIGWRPG